jgi:7-cyano-7-deazaguanine synthase
MAQSSDNGRRISDKRIATLVSGGLDSATLIGWAQREGYDQLAMFVNYGQDNLDHEFACARVNAQKFNVALEVVDIAGLRNSFVGRFPFPINLYDCMVKNPLGQITTFALSSLVAGIGVLAERYTLMLGIHHTDLQYRPVLDKTMQTLEETVNLVVESFTDDRRFELLLPFRDYPRPHVIRTGLELGVDYVNTWSCHENQDVPCNECEGCAERAEAFELARVEDPQLGKRIVVPVHANRSSVAI